MHYKNELTGKKLVSFDRVRSAILHENPSVTYAVDRIPTAAVLTYCEDCISLKECRVTYTCNNPQGLRHPMPGAYCSFGRPKTDEVVKND